MQERQETAGKFQKLIGLCESPAEEIRKKKDLLVVSHVDADGLTAAAIICTALDRCGLEYRPLFFRQLDESALEEVARLWCRSGYLHGSWQRNDPADL